MTTLQKDAKHLWHPFTQHATEYAPIAIKSAKGTVLYGEDGQEYLDLIASWWTTIHGHSHPKLNAAIKQQVEQMEHVMFGGFTHQPAVDLAEKLTSLLPENLSRVFYSDNGSTAVEVALKIAHQYWKNKGEQGRDTFLTFEGAYHGDTLGAMSVGRGSGFYKPFEDLMCKTILLPYPETWQGDENIEEKEASSISKLKEILKLKHQEISALIIEPLIQGAGGMRLCRPQFVQQVVELCRAHNILIIFDEVATGFGRLGTMFACEQIGIVPDLICLGKGLTAGYLPLSATVATEEIFQTFWSTDYAKAFTHGHTFTANPLGCAVALAGLKLFEEEESLKKVADMKKAHHAAMAEIAQLPGVINPRVKGSLLAFDLAGQGGYKASIGEKLKEYFLQNGCNIRPLGGTVYLLPPYCTTQEQLQKGYNVLKESILNLHKEAA